MKQEQIASLEIKIKKEYGNIAGIIVLKDDNAVYEKYFNQCSESDPIHIFSVTKSIISMLFGIAIVKGCIKSLDEKVIDFFPNYQIKKREKTIQHITIRNLLTMTAPYKYKFNPYPKYFSSEDWVISSLDFLVQSVWKTRHLKYGYLWWIVDEAEHSYAALGDGGNAIYVNPKDRIVVAVSSLFVPRIKDRIDFIKREIEPLFK